MILRRPEIIIMGFKSFIGSLSDSAILNRISTYYASDH